MKLNDIYVGQPVYMKRQENVEYIVVSIEDAIVVLENVDTGAYKTTHYSNLVN